VASDSAIECAKCGGSVDLHNAYVVGYSKQAAMEWVYLCADCEAALREWLARED
jgi:DNA-directed RNA polymerase subunit RPC12/RpoP